MPSPGRWSDEVKQQALTTYADAGAGVASRLTGVSQSTIRYWAREADVQPPDDYRAQWAKEAERVVGWSQENIRVMREDLRGKLLAQASRLVERMNEPMVDFVGAQGREVHYERMHPREVQHLAVAIGILIDKFRLESGEASAVVGSVDVLPKLDDHEKAALAEVLRNAIRERSEAEPEGASAVADVRD